MNLIVAVDKNWGIGFDGNLLAYIPEDLKRFRELTTGKVVVLGRKTMDTFPGKKPLKNRTNIILSRNPDYKVNDALVVGSVEELLDVLRNYSGEDVFVIGGESVYRAMLGYCDTAYVTKINEDHMADAHFPDLVEMPDWEMVSESEERVYENIRYTFQLWKCV